MFSNKKHKIDEIQGTIFKLKKHIISKLLGKNINKFKKKKKKNKIILNIKNYFKIKINV
jgi:hypothetical protein